MTVENSITTVSKLVGKAPVRSKIERNTNPRKKKKKQFNQGFKSRFKKKKKKKETQIEKLKELYIGNNSAILSIYLSCLFCVKECCVMAQNSASLVMCKKDL